MPNMSGLPGSSQPHEEKIETPVAKAARLHREQEERRMGIDKEDVAEVNSEKGTTSPEKELIKDIKKKALVIIAGLAMWASGLKSVEARDGAHRTLVLKEPPQVRVQLARQGGVHTEVIEEAGDITGIKIGPFQQRGADGNIVLDGKGKPKLSNLEETDALKDPKQIEEAEVIVEATGDTATIRENIMERPNAKFSIGGKIRHIVVKISLKDGTATIEKIETLPDTLIKG